MENKDEIDDLIDLINSPHGIDFCMEKQYPPYSILTQYVQRLESQFIFTKGDHIVDNKPIIILYGGHVEVVVDGENTCAIYATNGSRITVKASDHAIVEVQVWHSAKLTFESTGSAQVLEFKK